MQVGPGVKTGVMAIVEYQAQRIIPDGLCGFDADLVFAQLQCFLPRPVSANFGGRRVHTQILERQFKMHAVIETELEHAGFRAQLDGGGVGHGKGLLGIGLWAADKKRDDYRSRLIGSVRIWPAAPWPATGCTSSDPHLSPARPGVLPRSPRR